MANIRIVNNRNELYGLINTIAKSIADQVNTTTRWSTNVELHVNADTCPTRVVVLLSVRKDGQTECSCTLYSDDHDRGIYPATVDTDEITEAAVYATPYTRSNPWFYRLYQRVARRVDARTMKLTEYPRRYAQRRGGSRSKQRAMIIGAMLVQIVNRIARRDLVFVGNVPDNAQDLGFGFKHVGHKVYVEDEALVRLAYAYGALLGMPAPCKVNAKGFGTISVPIHEGNGAVTFLQWTLEAYNQIELEVVTRQYAYTGAKLVEVTDSGFKTTTTSLQKVLDKHALKDRYTRVLVGETAQL